MAILYANSRLFTGKYKKPEYIVMGCEEGSPFRRVFRSEGLAKRFYDKVKERPRITQLSLVTLGKR